MLKKIFAILLALAMLLSAAALAEDAAADNTAAEDDTLLVTLNGEEIRANNENLLYYVSNFASQAEGLKDPETNHIIRMYSMENVVQITLIMQQAKAAVTDEEVASYEEQAKAEWADILASYMEGEHGITDESSEEDRTAARADVIAELEAEGWTEERYVKEDTENLIYNGFLEKVQAQLEADPAFAVSDEEVQNYFDELAEEDRLTYEADPNAYVGQYEIYQAYPDYYSYFYGDNALYYAPAYRGITHILLEVDEDLLKTWTDLNAKWEEQQDAAAAEATDADGEAAADEEAEEPVTEEMIAAARQAIIDSLQPTIDEINEKLAGGASFDDLIVEYSTDPGMQDESTRANGYPVSAASMLYDQTFTNESMALEKVGEISAPVLTQFGVHILCYQKDIPAGPVELTDSLRTEIRDTLMSDKITDEFHNMVDRWEEEAEAVWTDAGLEWKYDQDVVDGFISRISGVEEEAETPAEGQE